MFLKYFYSLGFLFIIAACALPKQPALTKEEEIIFSDMKKKFSCTINRSYSAAYLKYGIKGDYILLFNVRDTTILPYLQDSGQNLATSIYRNVIKADTNVLKIQFQVADSIGVNTFKYSFFEYKLDSITNVR